MLPEAIAIESSESRVGSVGASATGSVLDSGASAESTNVSVAVAVSGTSSINSIAISVLVEAGVETRTTYPRSDTNSKTWKTTDPAKSFAHMPGGSLWRRHVSVSGEVESVRGIIAKQQAALGYPVL